MPEQAEALRAKLAAAGPAAQHADHESDDQHDPQISRRNSNAGLQRESAQSAKPTSKPGDAAEQDPDTSMVNAVNASLTSATYDMHLAVAELNQISAAEMEATGNASVSPLIARLEVAFDRVIARLTSIKNEVHKTRIAKHKSAIAPAVASLKRAADLFFQTWKQSLEIGVRHGDPVNLKNRGAEQMAILGAVVERCGLSGQLTVSPVSFDTKDANKALHEAFKSSLVAIVANAPQIREPTDGASGTQMDILIQRISGHAAEAGELLAQLTGADKRASQQHRSLMRQAATALVALIKFSKANPGRAETWAEGRKILESLVRQFGAVGVRG